MLVSDPNPEQGYYRKVVVQCDICTKQRTIDYHSYWFGRDDDRCRSCANKLNNKGKVYSPEWCKAIQQGIMKSPRYKGSRIQTGYKQIHSPEHPRVKNKPRARFVCEHILVMEQALGRYIEEYEIIHHINMNKLDNKIENLYLCSGQNRKESSQKHNACHHSMEQLISYLYKIGAVIFQDGKYQLSEATARLFAEVFEEK